MKRRLIAAIALALGVSFASTALAMNNPFVDLPAQHWAYGDVMKLAQAGIVEGYSDKTFRGESTITRYEMAEIVAKAMTNQDKANAEQKAILTKLTAEFKDELKTLGVRLDKLEKKADKFKWGGQARLLYDHAEKNGKFGGKDMVIIGRLEPVATLNDDWTWQARIQSIQDFITSGQSGSKIGTGSIGGSDGTISETNTTFEYVNIQGPLLGTKATLGRMIYTPASGSPAYGNNIDCKFDGAKFEFGNRLQTAVYYGKDDAKVPVTNGYAKQDDTTVAGIDLKYRVSKDTAITGGFTQYNATNSGNDSVNIWQTGVNSDISDVVNLKANYAKSNAGTDNKACYVMLTYKNVDPAKVGSWQAWVDYRNLQDNGVYVSNWDLPKTKGIDIGYAYVPAKNIVWRTTYADLKSTASATKDQKQKYFSSYVQFNF